MELLTKEITNEYKRRADSLESNGLQDTGERRSLRLELQEKCGLTELQAINVLNGMNVTDYIAIYRRRALQNAANQVRK